MQAADTNDRRPDWVSDENSSGVAFAALQTLYEIKKRFIRNHSKKSDYKNKSVYKIFKSEVVEKAGTSSTIFHTVKYKNGLIDELDQKNKLLLAAKNERLDKQYTGHRVKTKNNLISELREVSKSNENIVLKTSDEVLELTLNSIPLDVKRHLKIS